MEKVTNKVKTHSKWIPFNLLPVTQNCCFSVPLKVGTIMIAIICIITGIGACLGDSSSLYSCYPDIEIKVTVVFSRIFHTLLLFMSIFMIYEMITKIENSVLVFMIALLLVMIMTLIESIAWLVTRNAMPNKCPQTYILAIGLLLRLFIYGYFLIVVNSYRLKTRPLENIVLQVEKAGKQTKKQLTSLKKQADKMSMTV